MEFTYWYTSKFKENIVHSCDTILPHDPPPRHQISCELEHTSSTGFLGTYWLWPWRLARLITFYKLRSAMWVEWSIPAAPIPLRDLPSRHQAPWDLVAPWQVGHEGLPYKDATRTATLVAVMSPWVGQVHVYFKKNEQSQVATNVFSRTVALLTHAPTQKLHKKASWSSQYPWLAPLEMASPPE